MTSSFLSKIDSFIHPFKVKSSKHDFKSNDDKLSTQDLLKNLDYYDIDISRFFDIIYNIRKRFNVIDFPLNLEPISNVVHQEFYSSLTSDFGDFRRLIFADARSSENATSHFQSFQFVNRKFYEIISDFSNIVIERPLKQIPVDKIKPVDIIKHLGYDQSSMCKLDRIHFPGKPLSLKDENFTKQILLKIDIDSLILDYGDVEPIFAHCYFYNIHESVRISESFTISCNSKQIMEKFPISEEKEQSIEQSVNKFLFKLPQICPTKCPGVILVVRVEKILQQGEANDLYECYNKDEKTREKYRGQALTNASKLGRYRMPLAYGAIDLTKMIHATQSSNMNSMNNNELRKHDESGSSVRRSHSFINDNSGQHSKASRSQKKTLRSSSIESISQLCNQEKNSSLSHSKSEEDIILDRTILDDHVSFYRFETDKFTDAQLQTFLLENHKCVDQSCVNNTPSSNTISNNNNSNNLSHTNQSYPTLSAQSGSSLQTSCPQPVSSILKKFRSQIKLFGSISVYHLNGFSLEDKCLISPILKPYRVSSGHEQVEEETDSASRPRDRLVHVLNRPTTLDQYSPINSYRHFLYVLPKRLNLSYLKTQYRNITISIKLMTIYDDNYHRQLKCIYPRNGGLTFLNETFTSVQYHVKSPEFEEEFKIDFPHNADTSFCYILFTFYHINCQMKKLDSGEPVKVLIGYSWIPIIKPNMNAFHGGRYNLLISQSLPLSCHVQYPSDIKSMNDHGFLTTINWIDDSRELFQLDILPNSSVLPRDWRIGKLIKSCSLTSMANTLRAFDTTSLTSANNGISPAIIKKSIQTIMNDDFMINPTCREILNSSPMCLKMMEYIEESDPEQVITYLTPLLDGVLKLLIVSLLRFDDTEKPFTLKDNLNKRVSSLTLTLKLIHRINVICPGRSNFLLSAYQSSPDDRLSPSDLVKKYIFQELPLAGLNWTNQLEEIAHIIPVIDSRKIPFILINTYQACFFSPIDNKASNLLLSFRGSHEILINLDTLWFFLNLLLHSFVDLKCQRSIDLNLIDPELYDELYSFVIRLMTAILNKTIQIKFHNNQQSKSNLETLLKVNQDVAHFISDLFGVINTSFTVDLIRCYWNKINSLINKLDKTNLTSNKIIGPQNSFYDNKKLFYTIKYDWLIIITSNPLFIVINSPERDLIQNILSEMNSDEAQPCSLLNHERFVANHFLVHMLITEFEMVLIEEYEDLQESYSLILFKIFLTYECTKIKLNRFKKVYIPLSHIAQLFLPMLSIICDNTSVIMMELLPKTSRTSCLNTAMNNRSFNDVLQDSRDLVSPNKNQSVRLNRTPSLSSSTTMSSISNAKKVVRRFGFGTSSASQASSLENPLLLRSNEMYDQCINSQPSDLHQELEFIKTVLNESVGELTHDVPNRIRLIGEKNDEIYLTKEISRKLVFIALWIGANSDVNTLKEWIQSSSLDTILALLQLTILAFGQKNIPEANQLSNEDFIPSTERLSRKNSDVSSLLPPIQTSDSSNAQLGRKKSINWQISGSKNGNASSDANASNYSGSQLNRLSRKDSSLTENHRRASSVHNAQQSENYRKNSANATLKGKNFNTLDNRYMSDENLSRNVAQENSSEFDINSFAFLSNQTRHSIGLAVVNILTAVVKTFDKVSMDEVPSEMLHLAMIEAIYITFSHALNIGQSDEVEFNLMNLLRFMIKKTPPSFFIDSPTITSQILYHIFSRFLYSSANVRESSTATFRVLVSSFYKDPFKRESFRIHVTNSFYSFLQSNVKVLAMEVGSGPITEDNSFWRIKGLRFSEVQHLFVQSLIFCCDNSERFRLTIKIPTLFDWSMTIHEKIIQNAEKENMKSSSEYLEDVVKMMIDFYLNYFLLKNHERESLLVSNSNQTFFESCLHNDAICNQIDYLLNLAEISKNSPIIRMIFLREIAEKSIKLNNFAEASQAMCHCLAIMIEQLCPQFEHTHSEMPTSLVTDMFRFDSQTVPLTSNFGGLSSFSKTIFKTDILEESCCGNREEALKHWRNKFLHQCHLPSVSILFSFLPFGISLFETTISLFSLAGNYEIIPRIYSLFLLPLETIGAFEKLSQIHNRIHGIYEVLSKPPEAKRLVKPVYFKLTFYGASKDKSLIKTFIVKEPPCTTLAEVTQKFEYIYSKQFGHVEILKDSKKPDVANMKADDIYLQINFVEPFIDDQDTRRFIKTHSKYYSINKFNMISPFTKSGKAHGSLLEQHKLQVTYNSCRSFPWLTTRILAHVEQEKVISPIEVAFDDVNSRLNQLSSAISQKPTDIKLLQMVLQGCISPTVNQGPVEVARTFLKPKSNLAVQSESDMINQSNHNRLKICFKRFLEKCEIGLRLNKSLISSDQLEYQTELEKNFKQISSIIQSLL